MDLIAVNRSIFIAASPERVWRAVTTPGALAQWYAPGYPWEIPTLEAGAEVRFFNKPDDIQVAIIEVVNPPREFALHWQLAAEQSGADLRTAFRLEPVEGGTRVTIHESGFETLSAAERQASVEQTAAGYEHALAALKALVEAGPA